MPESWTDGVLEGDLQGVLVDGLEGVPEDGPEVNSTGVSESVVGDEVQSRADGSMGVARADGSMGVARGGT